MKSNANFAGIEDQRMLHRHYQNDNFIFLAAKDRRALVKKGKKMKNGSF
jgi:hypothetical protein